MKKLLLVATVALLTVSCGSKKDALKLKIDGSSTVYPISEVIVENYRKDNPESDVRPTIGESGTGGGFKKFVRNEIDIADASRPIKKSEDEKLKEAGIEYLEIPVAYDGLVVVVHKDNDWAKSMTVAELKLLWSPSAQDSIKRWNQIRPEWPNEEIHLYGAGTASGTFDYFTEAIVGESKSCRGDYTASEDDNVLVQGVSSDKLALGFFGIHYYNENKDKLSLVAIDDQDDSNGAGAVLPSLETVVNSTYQPLSRPLFIYVNKASMANEEFTKFVNYYVDKSISLIPETGYVPLEKEMYDLIKKRIAEGRTGSVYVGLEKTVGVKLAEVYK